MSIYSTKTISRAEAIRMLLEKQSINFTNDELGDLLDRLYSDETYNNYIVVDEKENLYE